MARGVLPRWPSPQREPNRQRKTTTTLWPSVVSGADPPEGEPCHTRTGWRVLCRAHKAGILPSLIQSDVNVVAVPQDVEANDDAGEDNNVVGDAGVAWFPGQPEFRPLLPHILENDRT